MTFTFPRLPQGRKDRNWTLKPAPIQGRPKGGEDLVTGAGPADGFQIEGDDLEVGLVIHMKQDIAEGVDDETMATIGEGGPPVAAVDADDKKLVFQSPSREQGPPEMDIGLSPGAGDEKNLGTSKGQSPDLLGKFHVEADEDPRPEAG